MKLNRSALYFWGVFCPLILFGALLALSRWFVDQHASQSSWLVYLPSPQTIVLLSVLIGILSLLLYVFVYQSTRQRIDQALLTLITQLTSGEATFDQAALGRDFQHHPVVSALGRFIQRTSKREARLLELTKKDLLTTFETQQGSETLLRERLNPSKEPFSVVAVRINNLRIINDMYGFHNGDKCIKAVADRLSTWPGNGIRMDSGDLLWLAQKQLTTDNICEIREQLTQSVASDAMSILMDIRIGLVECPAEADSSEALFRRAWLTLEEVSQSREIFRQYSHQLDKSYLRRLMIIGELEAVMNGRETELSLYYQPKVNLASGRVEAAEALIRWHNPVLGQVFPDEFIPLAEQTGLLSKLSLWVISQAIKDLVTFKKKRIPVTIAVNISAEDIADNTLLEHTLVTLGEAGLPSSLLSFELTESQLVDDPERAIECLKAFRRQGFKISIDDFGTGYSSLAYLKRLPVDEVKIDKSFVLQLDSQADDQSIVQTILALADRFNLSVVAEGVEVPQSLSLLQQWGCHWVQGYFVSRPLPLNAFIDWFLSETLTDWQKACYPAQSADGTHQAAGCPVARGQ